MAIIQQRKSFTKLADAKIWAYQTELELERASAGISPALIKLNLFEAKKRYIDSIVSQHKGKDSEIYRLDAIIKRLGQNRDIKDISPSDIAQYRGRRLKLVSTGTVRRELVVISGLFNTAIHEDISSRYISELSGDNVSQLFAETRNDLCEG